MSRIKKAIVAVVMVTAALLAPATPALADPAPNTDYGDGNWTCDYYEICFNALSQSVWDNEWGIGHTFFWGSMHHDQEILYEQYCSGCSFYLMDEAVGFWNRDSQCDVALWDISAGTWYVYGDYQRGYRGDAGAQKNNGHSRCF